MLIVGALMGAARLKQLKDCKALQSVSVWHTAVTPAGAKALKAARPDISIDGAAGK